MKEMLLNRLHEIEKEKDVKILFAAESGNRSWGFATIKEEVVRLIKRHQNA